MVRRGTPVMFPGGPPLQYEQYKQLGKYIRVPLMRVNKRTRTTTYSGQYDL